LSNEAQQYDFTIGVTLHDNDLRDYRPGKPLRLAIEIRNTGGHPLTINNNIDFRYDDGPHDRIQKRIVDEQREALPLAVIHAQPMDDDHLLALMDLIRFAERPLELAAGEACAAAFDLDKEGLFHHSRRMLVWAACGGRESTPIVIDLRHEAREIALEKFAEFDDDGPFRLIAQEAAPWSMPPVQPTDEAAAIEVAIGAWLHESRRDHAWSQPQDEAAREVVLVSRANLPVEFSSAADRFRLVVAQPYLDRPEKPLAFTTSGGRIVFQGRALCVLGVDVTRQTASVAIGEMEQRRVGAKAVVALQRQQGSWRATGEIKLIHP
jgi:hypothetical protein